LAFRYNDVVFSLLLQTPEAGGEFEYAPFIRSEQDENYDGVKRVVADPQRSAVRPPMGLGDFNVFMGDLSLHRVKPVIGAQRRIVALFSYDRDPGMVFDQSYVDEMHQAMTN
jgi:predicted 2-oxoglutarate/Fe(II)-dependent dioxygenase YbiX